MKNKFSNEKIIKEQNIHTKKNAVFPQRFSKCASNLSDALTADNTVAFEGTGGGKFPKSVTNHVFCHEDSNKGSAVMHIEGVSNEIRKDHRPSGPGLDGLFGPGFLHSFHLFDHMIVHKRTFFDGSCHDYFFLRSTMNLLLGFFG